MSDTGKHLVYYLDVDHGERLGTHPSFEEAERYVLECLALHAKRRELELKYWPADEVIEDEYQRVDRHTWKGGLYGYKIVPYAAEHDTGRGHLEYLKGLADEEYIAAYGETFKNDQRA